MPYKRNKLLVFLGLITVAISKSHNQRHSFEPQYESRRISASKLSSSHHPAAQPRVPDDLESSEEFPSSYLDRISELGIADKGPHILTRRVSEGDFDGSTSDPKVRPRLRAETVIHDTKDLSEEISSQELFFEPQKVNIQSNRQKLDKKQESQANTFKRRSGPQTVDEPNSSPETEKTKHSLGKDTKNKLSGDNAKNSGLSDKKLITASEKTKDENVEPKKTKPKRKKVIRYRVRGQNNNKTQTIKAKQTPKPIDSEKSKEIFVSDAPKPKTADEGQLPEIRSPDKKSAIEIEFKLSQPEIPQAKVNFDTNVDNKPAKKKKAPNVDDTKRKSGEKKKAPNADETIKNEPPKTGENGEFHRRSGPKARAKSSLSDHIPEPNWDSAYKTENHDKEDNVYLYNFNYMGNKNDPFKEAQYSPGDSQRIPGKNQQLYNKASVALNGEKPTEELDIGHLEQVSGKFLNVQGKAAKNKVYPQLEEGYNNPSPPNNGYQFYSKKPETLEDTAIDNKDLPAKQYTPTVTVKRKNTRQQNNPVWTLQAREKTFSDGEQRKIPKSLSSEFPDSFKTSGEKRGTINHKDGDNYFIRSFIEHPTGAHVNVDLKGDELTQMYHQTKEKNSNLRTPHVIENKNPGNYFMHMYKKVGDFENFEILSGEKPENGYLSSFKLNWSGERSHSPAETEVESRVTVPKIKQPTSAGKVSFRKDGGKDIFEPQPSEDIMHFEHYHADDFMSPLNDDKSHLYPNLPIMHRRKRSLSTLPRVSSHFKIGESETVNNHTLRPNSKETPPTERIGRSFYGKPVTVKQRPPLSQVQLRRVSKHVEIPLNEQKVVNTMFYHNKPAEQKDMTSFKTDFDAAIFDKYETPSRSVTNIQLFSSYQSPNRNPMSVHDMTYFHKDKNSNVNIKITDEASARTMPNKPLVQTDVKNKTAFNNFKLRSDDRVIQSSTDVKASYVKPANETSQDRFSQMRDETGKISQENSKALQTRSENYSTPQTTSEKTGEPVRETSKAVVDTTVKSPNVVPNTPIFTTAFDRKTVIPNINATSNKTLKHSVISSRKMRKQPLTASSDKRTGIPTVTKVSIRRKAKPTVTKTTASESKIITTASGLKPKRTETTISEVKSVVTKATSEKPKQITTKVPSENANPNDTKITEKKKSPVVIRVSERTNPITTERDQPKSTASTNSDINSTETTSFDRRKLRLSPNTESDFKSTTATMFDRQTTAPFTITESDMKSTATTFYNRRVTRPASTTEFDEMKSTTIAISDKTTPRPSATAPRFFRKAGDLSVKADNGSPPAIQSRRSDDKHWLSVKQESLGGNHEKIQNENPRLSSEKNIYEKKSPVHPERNGDFQFHSNELDHEVSQQWHNPLTSLSASEHKYPMFSVIPKTHFSCKNRAPGYYADPETGCQVFHMCQGSGSKHSFLCPNTTIFNQRLLVCDWHMKVECENSESFYGVNDNLYQTEKRDYKRLQTNSWNAPSNPNSISPKSSYPEKVSYRQNNHKTTQAYELKNTEVTKIPQFVVNHFKENIPRAEYGTPKSVTKSYRAIIVKPITTISSSVKKSRKGAYVNADTEPVLQQHQQVLHANNAITPNKYVEEHNNRKSSWNHKEMEKTLNEELQNLPEVTKSYPREHELYLNPSEDKLLVNNENSLDEPNYLHTNGYTPQDNEEVHFAGRQNEKVVVVSKNQLQTDFDSSDQTFPQYGKTTPYEPLVKITQPIPTTIATQPPHYKIFPTEKILIHQANNNQGPSSPRPQTTYERNYNKAPTYSTNNYDAVTKIPDQANVRSPQYIYPLNGIVQNIDGSTEFSYGYRGEDPKNYNSQRVQIFKSTYPKPTKSFTKQESGIPRSRDEIWIKPTQAVARSNDNIVIKPVSGTSRSNLMMNPETVISRPTKIIQTEPRTEISVKNKNLLIIPISKSSVYNQDTSRIENGAPKFNKLIHGRDSDGYRSSKNIPAKTDMEHDPYAEKIKLRISEIKSGVESINAQVGKILGNDDRTFKNVRVFKLKPDALNGELEEIKLTPFRFQRQNGLSERPKLKEKKREELSIDVLSGSDSQESSKIESTPSSFVLPVNRRKNFDDVSNSKHRAHDNSNRQLYHTQSAPIRIQQVTADTSLDSADMSTPLPNNVNYDSTSYGHQQIPTVVPHNLKNENHRNEREFNPIGSHHESTSYGHQQIPTVVPHNLKNENQGYKREFNPIGSHQSVDINQHRKPLDYTSDSDQKIKKHYDSALKDYPDKKYKIKYVPLITIDRTSKGVGTEGKNEHRGQDTRQDVVHTNEKSKHFDHVFVPKVTQRDSTDFIFPDKIRIEEKSFDPNNFGNFERYGNDMKQEIKNEFYNIHDSDFQGKVSPNAQLTNNGETVYSSNVHSPKNDVRTFVLITKPGQSGKEITTIQPNHLHNNYRPSLIPVQAKSHPEKEDSGRSPECDESLAQKQNPVFALQLGKNGPSREFVPAKSPNKARDSRSSPEESGSKCHDEIDSRTNTHESSSSPESEEFKQNEWNEQNTFYAQPTPKIGFKVSSEKESENTPGKSSATYDRKAIEAENQNKIKPIKLFELHQRNSRPAFTKPAHQTPTTTNPRHYSLTPGTMMPRNVVRYEDSPNTKSVERSKRVVNSRATRYEHPTTTAVRKTNQQSYISKRPETVRFPVERKTSERKVAEKSTSESSDNSSSQSRYADIEKAAELKAERMIREQKKKT